MNLSTFILSLCFFLPLNAGAQVYLGAQISPGDLIGRDEDKTKKSSEDAFADAFILEFSSSALYAVFKSTHLKKNVQRYMRRGFYRQEMVMMFLIAEESSSTFKSLAADIKTGKTLKYIAAEKKINIMDVFKKSEKAKKEIEVRMEEARNRKAESGKQKKAKEKKQNNGEKKEKKNKKIKK